MIVDELSRSMKITVIYQEQVSSDEGIVNIWHIIATNIYGKKEFRSVKKPKFNIGDWVHIARPAKLTKFTP